MSEEVSESVVRGSEQVDIIINDWQQNSLKSMEGQLSLGKQRSPNWKSPSSQKQPEEQDGH